MRAAARARAVRHRPGAGDGHLAVAGLDAPRAAARGGVRARSAAGRAVVLRAGDRRRCPSAGARRARRGGELGRSDARRRPAAAGRARRRAARRRCPSRSPTSWSATTRRAAPGSRWPSGSRRCCSSATCSTSARATARRRASLAPYCRSLTCIDTNARMIEAARERLAQLRARARRRSPTSTSCPSRRRRSTRCWCFTRSPTPSARRGRWRSARACCARAAGWSLLCLDEHQQHGGHRPLRRAPPRVLPARRARPARRAPGSTVVAAEVACREAKKPHLQVVLAIADKPGTLARTSHECAP